MPLASVVLFILGTFVGVWGSSLLWRLALVRLERRRARKGNRPARLTLTAWQQGIGLLLAVVCLPVGVGALAAGEYVSTWFDQFSIGSSWDTASTMAGAAANALLFLVAAGAVFAGWSFDPARGRLRCPKCWYSMEGGDGKLCPECGRASKSPRDLLRTRRSPRVVALALLLLGATMVFYAGRMVQNGRGLRYVPTGVLIAAFPWLPESALHNRIGSLGYRVNNNELSESQRQWLRARCATIISTSTNRARVEGAVAFYGEYVGEGMPRIRSSLAATFAVEVLSSKVAPLPYGPERRLWDLLPDTLDEADAAQVARAAEQALLSKDAAMRAVAWDAVALTGPGAKVFMAGAIREVQSASFAAPQALRVLLLQSGGSDEAWAEVCRVADKEPALLDGLRVRGMLELAPDAEHTGPKLLAALAGPSDEVASWAAMVLLAQHDRDAAGRARVLAALGEPRAALPEVRALSSALEHAPAAAEQIRSMLVSPDPHTRAAGLFAAGFLGAEGEDLVPVLTGQFQQSALPYNDPRRRELLSVLVHIREAARAAKR